MSRILKKIGGNAAVNIMSGNKRKINGQGNVLDIRGRIKNTEIKIIGNHNKVIIEEGAIVSNGLVYILGNNNTIKIGTHVKFKAGDLWVENDGCRLAIGAGTTVVQAHLAVTESGRNLSIGEDCMLSRGIEIRTGDSHSIIDLTTGKKINNAQDIAIAEHVWIGEGVTILKGVTVGKNSIIGTGSIVTKPVPQQVAVAGVPARVIRTNVTWSRKRFAEDDK